MDTAAPTTSHWKLPRSAQRPLDVLAECLALLTHYYQHPFSTETLVSGLPLDNGKLTPELFVRAAARADLSARVMRRQLEDISPNTLPVVLLLKDQQACIALSHDPEHQRWKILQPESGGGETTLRTEALAALYDGSLSIESVKGEGNMPGNTHRGRT